MEIKNKFKNQLKIIRRNEFFTRIYRLIPVSLFIVLSPILIWDNIIKKEYLIILLLLIAELAFFVLAFLLVKGAKDYLFINNSRIFQCINSPEKVTEILVTSQKIVFEIKGLEDETIYLKNSKFKANVILNIKKIFGEEKVIMNL